MLLLVKLSTACGGVGAGPHGVGVQCMELEHLPERKRRDDATPLQGVGGGGGGAEEEGSTTDERVSARRVVRD